MTATAFEIAYTMLAADNYSQFLGLELVSAEPDLCIMAMTVQVQHLNGIKTCHGGCLFSLADTTFAHACNSSNRIAVGQACHITYLEAAFEGDRLMATAKRIGGSGRSGLFDVSVTRESDAALLVVFRGQSRQIKGQVIPDEDTNQI